MMKKYLKTSLILCLLFLYSCTQTKEVNKKESVTVNLAETWSEDFPIFSKTVKNMVFMAQSMSSGRFQFKTHSSNQHQRPFGVFDMVRSGEYEMGHSASYYWEEININTIFFTTLPFGMNALEQYAWFYYGDGLSLMNKVYEPYDLLSFPGGNTGPQMAGWYKKEIKDISDFKDLKIRLPSIGGKTLERLGAKLINNLPADDLYIAMRSGDLDAAEWVGPYMDSEIYLQRAANYYYTGWQEPGSELQFLVNEKFWNNLPGDLRSILTVAMKASAYDGLVYANYKNGLALKKLRKNSPETQILSFPPQVLEGLKTTYLKIIEEITKSNPLAKEIFESRTKFLLDIHPWTTLSEN